MELQKQKRWRDWGKERKIAGWIVMKNKCIGGRKRDRQKERER